MTDIPRVPPDPEGLKAWVENLDQGQLRAILQQMSAPAGGPVAAFEPRNRAIDLAPPPDQPSLLTLTIELLDIEPRIWRRLALPGDLTLDKVHLLFQAAMGWTDSHLHRFSPGAEGGGYDQPYFITEFDEEEGDEGTREDGVRLDQVLREPGDRLTYSYDFGDNWQHAVLLESIAPLDPGDRAPRCLDGAGACPPEDVGGTFSHSEVADWLRAGSPADAVPQPFESAEHAHGWLPEGYDPDAFDADETTEEMRTWAAGQHLPWHGVPEALAELVQALRFEGWDLAMTWLAALGPRVPVALDDDEVLRAARPWLAVLEAVGTQTRLTDAGYLPPAAVKQIAQATGLTQWWIGPANREIQVWPVAALRAAAQETGLLRKAKGVLTPTTRARAVAGRPRALVAAVLPRLPLGKGFEREAGWFALLGTAAGVSGADLDNAVARILTDRGWRAGGTSPLAARDARDGSRPTLDALAAMAGGPESVDQALMTSLARAVLLGVAEQG